LVKVAVWDKMGENRDVLRLERAYYHTHISLGTIVGVDHGWFALGAMSPPRELEATAQLSSSAPFPIKGHALIGAESSFFAFMAMHHIHFSSTGSTSRLAPRNHCTYHTVIRVRVSKSTACRYTSRGQQ
jgi:hypothetical protein